MHTCAYIYIHICMYTHTKHAYRSRNNLKYSMYVRSDWTSAKSLHQHTVIHTYIHTYIQNSINTYIHRYIREKRKTLTIICNSLTIFSAAMVRFGISRTGLAARVARSEVFLGRYPSSTSLPYFTRVLRLCKSIGCRAPDGLL